MYFDPGTGSLIIQLLIAGIASIGAFFALYDSKNKGNNPKFFLIDNTLIHRNWNYDKDGNFIREDNIDLNDYDDCYKFTTKVLLEFISYINEREVLKIRNSTISLISLPEKYKNKDEEYLSNPLNISRYLINNYVGDNYKYIK